MSSTVPSHLRQDEGGLLAEEVLSPVLWSRVSDSITRPPLLLVSLDGLRPEYLQTWHGLLPVLDKLSQ